MLCRDCVVCDSLHGTSSSFCSLSTDKDYQLAIRPAPLENEIAETPYGKVIEVTNVKDFSFQMESRGLLGWWRKGMGYA